MKIVLAPQVAINLECLVGLIASQEFSGVGFAEISNGDLHVYDILLLNVGSGGYSEIPADKLVQAVQDRPDKDKLRLWFHRHPIEGWSSTDLETIMTAPLGGIPELVRWSASIVRTPTHWIGRVDNHLNKTHVVAEVEPNISQELTIQALSLLKAYWISKNSCPPTICASDFLLDLERPLPPAHQPLLFEAEETDDWLDANYEDDEEQGWGVCTEQQSIEDVLEDALAAMQEEEQ